MIAVDTNILVHAHRADSPDHQRALKQLTELVDTGQPWAIPWPCVHEFISIVTKAVMKPPSTIDQACDAINTWLQCGTVQLIGEGQNHLQELRRLCKSGHFIGGAVHDARVAAICIVHGVTELWTADRDFLRISGLRTANPLEG